MMYLFVLLFAYNVASQQCSSSDDCGENMCNFDFGERGGFCEMCSNFPTREDCWGTGFITKLGYEECLKKCVQGAGPSPPAPGPAPPAPAPAPPAPAPPAPAPAPPAPDMGRGVFTSGGRPDFGREGIDSGACSDQASHNAWENGGCANYADDVASCGESCFYRGSCVTDCMIRKRGYGQSCAKCMGDGIQCAKDNCMWKCLGGKEACISCSKEHCAAAFVSCSGINGLDGEKVAECPGSRSFVGSEFASYRAALIAAVAMLLLIVGVAVKRNSAKVEYEAVKDEEEVMVA